MTVEFFPFVFRKRIYISQFDINADEIILIFVFHLILLEFFSSIILKPVI